VRFQSFRILEPLETARVVTGLSRLTFADGKITALGRAREVKHNLQADRSEETSELDQLIMAALMRSTEFQNFAFPKRMVAPTYSRYEPGMEYGFHVDAAIMNQASGAAVRTDLAMTLFLSDPAGYDGGELILDLESGEQQIKLDAGEAIVYSATSLHRVARITRGVRLAAVTWIQSAVRDEQLRSILFGLKTASLRADSGADRELATMIDRSYNNLLRYAIDL
jgi:PKHD-type hydroxylase